MNTEWFYEPEGVLWASDQEGVHAFSHVFFFDAEMIYCDSDYPDFINDLADAIEIRNRLTEVSSHFHHGTDDITIRYSLDGKPRELTFEQPNDWIPPDILDSLFKDLSEIEGRIRLAELDGQGGMVVWALTDQVDKFLALYPDFEPWSK